MWFWFALSQIKYYSKIIMTRSTVAATVVICNWGWIKFQSPYVCVCVCVCVWTLSSGVHVQNVQVCYIGIYVLLWFAAFLPFTYISHFFPCYLSPTPPPLSLPYSNRPQCVVLPSLCPRVLIVQHPPMSENMQCLVFCSCVSLLRMMFSRFIHVPTNDTNSSFLIAA